MISQKAKYALRALIALAGAEGEMTTGEVARAQAIPRKFLEQILLDMKRDGLVQSRRGKLGGYALLRPAEEISFLHVLRLIDGPVAPLPCLSQTAYRRCDDCREEQACEIRRVFAAVAQSMVEVLARTTVADAVREPRVAADIAL